MLPKLQQEIEPGYDLLCVIEYQNNFERLEQLERSNIPGQYITNIPAQSWLIHH